MNQMFRMERSPAAQSLLLHSNSVKLSLPLCFLPSGTNHFLIHWPHPLQNFVIAVRRILPPQNLLCLQVVLNDSLLGLQQISPRNSPRCLALQRQTLRLIHVDCPSIVPLFQPTLRQTLQFFFYPLQNLLLQRHVTLQRILKPSHPNPLFHNVILSHF